ncbi:MAG: type I addiction module toxin, SymE family [Verrucomicrobia bacterium]|nr:type I addiction module toxin, SymE family [Verrucomicrobiota bacterium]
MRTLQIEADGDRWKGLIKPKIRLMGRWLEQAGFPPGHRVQVTCVAPGVIELRSPVASPVIAKEQPSTAPADEPF